MEKINSIIGWFLILASVYFFFWCLPGCGSLEDSLDKAINTKNAIVKIYKEGEKRVEKKDALCNSIDRVLENCQTKECKEGRLDLQSLCDGIDEYLGTIQNIKDDIFEVR